MRKSNPLKILSLCLLLLTFMSMLSACYNRREMNTLGIVLGIGLDKPAQGESGQIQMTTQILKPSGTGKSEGRDKSQKPYVNLSLSGESIYEIVRKSSHQIGRELYFPHNQMLLISEEVAKEGLQPYLDFFNRDPSIRYDNHVLITKCPTSEVLDILAGLESLPSVSIRNLIKATALNSQTSKVRLLDLNNRLLSKTTAPIVPFLSCQESDKGPALVLEHTAVFQGDKLVGELNKLESRGVLWVLDKIQYGALTVKSPESGQPVSLEIIHADCKVTPKLQGDQVVMKVKIKEYGNLVHQNGTETLVTPEAIKKLKQAKAASIQQEILAAFAKAKELEADVFGFGDMVRKKYPREWAGMEDHWGEIFPTVQLEFDIQAIIRTPGEINKPVKAEGSKQ